MTALTRDSIFISHANPEDYAFTVWLGSRLTAAGYEVWADMLRLRGGQDWQRLLEYALRSEGKIDCNGAGHLIGLLRINRSSIDRMMRWSHPVSGSPTGSVCSDSRSLSHLRMWYRLLSFPGRRFASLLKRGFCGRAAGATLPGRGLS